VFLFICVRDRRERGLRRVLDDGYFKELVSSSSEGKNSRSSADGSGEKRFSKS